MCFCCGSVKTDTKSATLDYFIIEPDVPRSACGTGAGSHGGASHFGFPFGCSIPRHDSFGLRTDSRTFGTFAAFGTFGMIGTIGTLGTANGPVNVKPIVGGEAQAGGGEEFSFGGGRAEARLLSVVWTLVIWNNNTRPPSILPR